MARSQTIHFTISKDDARGVFIASVHPMSYGPFPMGTKPLPFEADTADGAFAGLKKEVKKILRGDRISFVEVGR